MNPRLCKRPERSTPKGWIVDKAPIEAEVRLRYAAVRDVIADTGRIVALQIGHEQTDVAVGDGLDPLSKLPFSQV